MYLTKEKELIELEEVKKALVENVSTLKDKLDAARNNFVDESSIHEKYEQKLALLKKSCESKDTEIFVLQESIAKIRNEMEAVVLELKEVASTLNASEAIAALHSLKEDIKEANGSLTDCGDIISTKDRKSTRSNESFENIELSSAIVANLSELKLYINSLKQAVLSFKEKITLKDLEASKLEASIDHMKESLHLEKNKSRELSETLKKQNYEFTSLQEKFLFKDKELNELQEVKKELDENVSSLKHKLDAASIHSDLILTLERRELSATESCKALSQQCAQEKAKYEELEQKLSQTEKESQKKLDILYDLIEVLERCEYMSYCSQKKNILDSQMYKENISHLKRTVECQENATEDLEKALCDVQKQLRDLQKSSQEKLDDQEQKVKQLKQKNDTLMEENEKMKLKLEELKKQTLELRIVEEENKQLKSKVLQHESQPESSKRVLKERGNRDYSVETDDGKADGAKRKSKKTSVRKKGSSETKEIESSRVSSLRSRENKINYVEEQLGDSDAEAFEPQRRRVPKKGTSVASLQVRKKIAEDSENISPVRKFANYVGSTLKAAGTNVVKNMPSPRMTRGKKKLFNTDAH
ncbi:myosin-13-like [Uloborus diversus]|uniref:myosin-13-like n=1 Tax=Uloborus diversus TaxID=327109 RepID=UPI00240A4683|nr:myosin-13-like [Uloborus diversus]